MWATAQTQVITTASGPEADDDTLFYRLFGFSLFVSIEFRKRIIYGRLRVKYTLKRKQTFKKQYALLVSLKESDKSVLPACIKLQDRGKMTFPHYSFLPFARECSKAIKAHLNDTAYRHHGRYIVQVQSAHYNAKYN